MEHALVYQEQDEDTQLESDSVESEIGEAIEQPSRLSVALVPLMLFASSAIMATAWLGHLRFKAELTFWVATFFAWLLVLPEYALNIKALRLGYGRFSGGQMGAFRLCSGVVCITLVSRYFLNESMTTQKLLGFAVMMLAMILISDSDEEKHARN